MVGYLRAFWVSNGTEDKIKNYRMGIASVPATVLYLALPIFDVSKFRRTFLGTDPPVCQHEMEKKRPRPHL
jgi:hypothetical protein